MGFIADIETNIGEYLRVLRTDGLLGGKAALSFITAGWVIDCPESEADVKEWFSKLEAYAKEPIYQLFDILMQASYSGEWDYNEDEYEFFLHRHPEDPMTEERFKKTLQDIEGKWVDVKALLACVDELLRLLTEAKLEETWWYVPGETELDLQALSQTLSLATNRRARRVRIRFT